MQSRMRLGARPAGEVAVAGRTIESECKVYMSQLLRHFGEPPPAARLEIDQSQEDPCVVCIYDNAVIIATYYAFLCQTLASPKWDSDSLEHLRRIATA